VPVLKPVNDGTRYDLVFELGGRFLRVQCKWAQRVGEVVIIRCHSCRRGKQGLIHRPYTADEVDVIAAYCAELDRCFVVPVDRTRQSAIQLRLAPTRNNQNKGVNWAENFDFAATLQQLVGP
jgi:hypothetical protein